MATDITQENPIFVTEIYAKTHYRVSHWTVRRWCHTGLRVHGKQIRLESLQIGGRLATTREALERFFNQLKNARSKED